jgi:hypothetical protein
MYAGIHMSIGKHFFHNNIVSYVDFFFGILS